MIQSRLAAVDFRLLVVPFTFHSCLLVTDMVYRNVSIFNMAATVVGDSVFWDLFIYICCTRIFICFICTNATCLIFLLC